MTTTGGRSRGPRSSPATRPTAPEEPEAITTQFALLKSVLDLTGLLQAQTEHWEAEDAIGAFCLEADEDDRSRSSPAIAT